MCITEEVVDNEVFNNVIITIGLGTVLITVLMNRC